MTVDTVVKIVESEKCGLDMSCYEDLCSSPTSAVIVGGDGNGGGNGNGVCNSDGKEGYVFVNGSDVSSSDDRIESYESEELKVEKLSVERGEDVKVTGDVEIDSLEDGVEVEGEQSKVEDKFNVREEGAGLVVENGVITELENGGSDSNDGRDVGGKSSEAKESSDPKLEVEEVCQTGDNGNVSVDCVASRSLEVDDNSKNSVSDSNESTAVEAHDITAVSISPDAPEPSEIEAQLDKAINNIPDTPEPSVDEVDESSSSKPDVEEVVYETADNGIASCSFDDDDKSKISVPYAQELTIVESQDNIAVNNIHNGPNPSAIEPQIDSAATEVHEGELKAKHIMLLLENRIKIQGSEPENLEDQAGEPVVIENNSDVHLVEVPVAGMESAACLLTESKPLETDGSHQSDDYCHTEAQSLDSDFKVSFPLGTGHQSDDYCHTEAQSLDSDFKVSFPLAAEDKRLLLDDAIFSEHSFIRQQQSERPVDGDNEIHDLIEAELKIDEEGDVDPVTAGGKQESVDSEAAGFELDQGEFTVLKIGSQLPSGPEESPDFQSLPDQSEGELNQGNLVFKSVDKSAVENEPETVMTETRGSQEASTEEGVQHEETAEQIRSLDVIDKDILFENCTSEKRPAVEDTTSMSTLQSADDTTMDENQNDLGYSYTRDYVSKTNVIPASDESSEDAGSSVRSEDNYLSLSSVELLVPCDPNTSNECRVDDDISSVRDNSTSCWADDTCSQTKLENSYGSFPYSVHYNKLETGTANGEIDVPIKSHTISDGALMPKIRFGSFKSVSPFSHNDINLRSNILNKPTTVSTSSSECKVYSTNGVVLLDSQENGDHSYGFHHGTASAQVARSEQIDEVSTSSVEGCEADSSVGQNINPNLVRRPFYWLVKIPRVDLGRHREQLRQSRIELSEKTETRNARQAERNKQQTYCGELKRKLDAAKSEVKDTRDLVKAKRREIEEAQDLINDAKHGVTIEDVDHKIFNLEHTLQHETHTLRDEREFVREIKQLHHQRRQLLAYPQRQKEIQHARKQRDYTEKQLKVLRKELGALRDNLAKADEQVRAAQKKQDNETALLIDLKHKCRSAADNCTDAYVRLTTLEKQLNRKNTAYYKGKNDKRVANNYAVAGEKDSLEGHCVNQVEKFMEKWNKNEEFRNDYIQRKESQKLWKHGTLDDAQLSIDNVQPSTEDVSDNRVNASDKTESSAAVLTMERDLPPVETKDLEDESSKKVEKKVAQVSKRKDVISRNSVAKQTGKVVTEEDKEEPRPTKEEEELARKAEQLRREEEADRLREQRRLEERAKAEEALERKRKNAMKAQARAEFKARKEDEQKEKEREKRAQKKEKKRGLNPEITENEPGQPSEPVSEQVKEPGVTEKPATVTKRTQKAYLHTKKVKTTKAILPTLRNQGKRGLLCYWSYTFVALLAIALFFLGGLERIQTIKQHISGLLDL